MSSWMDKQRSNLEYKNDTFAIEICTDAIIDMNSKKFHKKFFDLSDRDDMFGKMSNIYTVIESPLTIPVPWLVAKSSLLYDTLNDFLLHSEQHGFTQHFYDAEYAYASTLPEPDPKKLTLDILSAGFIVWLITVMIACFVFVIEHVVAYFTRKP
jgi:hypothetical protein